MSNSAVSISDTSDTAYLPWSSVFLGFSMVTLFLAVSWIEHLGMGREVIVASFRGTAQLALLGYILVPLFDHPSIWASFLFSFAMGLIAAREAMVRLKYVYSGIYERILGCIYIPSVIVLIMAMVFLIPVDPFWKPQYFVPIGGMLLNSCLNGVSIGLSGFIKDMYENRSSVNAMLSMGANRNEAVRPMVIAHMRTGLIPILNNMRVLGLVAIPGMMTGQILGGNSPEQAARYQMIIYFLICVAACFSLLFILIWTREALFDDDDRLCVSSELVVRRGNKDDILVAIFKSIGDFILGLYRICAESQFYQAIKGKLDETGRYFQNLRSHRVVDTASESHRLVT